MKAYYLVKKTCRFLRTIHGQKFHTLLFLYQDITKPRAPISPSGRSTDRRPSAGMSPVPRGPKVKEHLRQPFCDTFCFVTRVLSGWGNCSSSFPSPVFDDRANQTHRLPHDAVPRFLVLCKLSSRLKTFEVSVKGDAFTFLY